MNRRRGGVAMIEAAVAALAASLAIGACGSGATTATRTATTTPATTTGSAATATSAAASTSSTATSSSGAAQPRARAGAGPRGCVSGAISVSIGQSTAGLSHVGEPLLFANTGSAPCTLSGYPGAALVGPGGRQVQAKRTPNGYLGGLSASATADPVVVLRAHQTAAALLEGEDIMAGGAACPASTALLVTPPNSTVTSRIARSVTMCDPQIHPVVAGASGSEH